MINKCINIIQDIVFSQACMVCKAQSDNKTAICRSCSTKLPENRHYCLQCALPLESGEQLLCPSCQNRTPQFQSAFIPFRYEKPIDELIWKFKFRNDLVSGKLLAGLFVQKLTLSKTGLPDVLIPVPLHSSRLRQRGYNQSLWLANEIAKHTAIPVDNRLIKRTLKTPPQHELGHKQRSSILKNAFGLKHACHYQHVAILDDVLTTGSTINEIARLLRKNNDTHVQAWALARTVKK